MIHIHQKENIEFENDAKPAIKNWLDKLSDPDKHNGGRKASNSKCH